MKLNFAYPATGAQKTIEVDDDKKLSHVYDKRIAQEVVLDFLGGEFTGYVAKITGGHDKQGFAMRQGVLAASRVSLLLPIGLGNRRGRKGERARKAVRGCIVAHDVAVLHLVIVKKGPSEISGLTDRVVPRRLGPKRASNIRKLFLLSKGDDVRKYVVKRTINKDGKTRPKIKAPKIQRLVTPQRLQHKRQIIAAKKQRHVRAAESAKAYADMLSNRKVQA
ncbi:40S small subunit ribosomal protein eS6 (rpS6) [Andalucia godoyi]|uniref:40S ribosomal protein S6 n=1 Tax=Andalucia godoyi TaxID=505711 RepID=A0A8K0AHK2_ANDGO|nr:40S small subunit ribosomal protein eS6 (rpS6) [Andalucia godoyi]WCZ58471.1 40S ribosomal protein S6 [Andalucia godoyi]|eukprot:ANDGO_06289.mRNA.1 40S small subunit ribosomal protein eS6 (rpS6)